jgi:hypothetical protein
MKNGGVSALDSVRGFSRINKDKYKNFLNFIEENDETNIRNVI